MNTDDCCESSPDFQDDRARLFTEIAELKQQRNELIAQLAECRTENRKLRARLGEDG